MSSRYASGVCPKLTGFLLAAVAALSTVPAIASAGGVPALRITAPNGERSVLIGSIHVPVGGLKEPAPSIFIGARHYVVEHTGSSNLPSSDPGSLAPPQWAQSLTEAELNTYLSRAKCAGVSEPLARDLLKQPTPHEANGFAYWICPTPRNTSDRDGYMRAVAPRSLASHPEPLEDDDWVERQRRKVSSATYIEAFRWALEHDPKTVLEETRDALNRGDYDALRHQVLDSFGSRQAAANYGHYMVDERNAAWLPNLERILDDGAAVIVVGAMHIPGPTGLMSLLRRDGYKVEEINWPAASADGDVR